MTPASWMRKFIREHPDYKMDSRIPQTTAYDLMVACKEIGEGRRPCPELLGNIEILPVFPAANPKKQTGVKGCAKHQELLSLYMKRAKGSRINTLEKDLAEQDLLIQKLQKE